MKAENCVFILLCTVMVFTHDKLDLYIDHTKIVPPLTFLGITHVYLQI